MKRLLALTTVFLLLLPTISVFAETETPTKPRVSVHQQRKTSCPPSYVGQSKTCIYVPNPDYDKATKTVIKPPVKYPTPTRPIPTANPTGYYFAMDFVLDQIAKTEVGRQAVDTFWNDVDTADQALGNFVNAIPPSVRQSYEAVFEQAVADGQTWMELSQPLFDSIFGGALNAIEGTADDAVKAKAGEMKIATEKPSPLIADAIKKYNWVSIMDSYNGQEYSSWSQQYTTVYGFWGVIQLSNKEFRAYGWRMYGTTVTFEGTYYSHKEQKDAIAEWNTKGWLDNFNSYKRSVAVQGAPLFTKNTTVSSAVSDSTASMTMPNGNVRMTIGTEVGHGTTGTVYKDDETGETWVETRPIEVPDLVPYWLPSGGVGETKIGLIPEKPTKDDTRYIPKEIVVTPDGNPINKDGTVGTKPVVDVEKITDVKPVVPPKLPPKDTKAPTGEDLPTKDAEEEGNRWKALVTNKFPFSLPWDVYNVISVLTAEPERPELDININQKILGVNVPIKAKHDFAWMDDFIPFVRTFILIGFTLFLILKTRTLMGGAQ